jgi:hypothetical protein
MLPHFNFGRGCRESPVSLAFTLLFAITFAMFLGPRTLHERDLQQAQFSSGPVPPALPGSLGIF